LLGEHLEGHNHATRTLTLQLMDLSTRAKPATKLGGDSIDSDSGDLLVGVGIEFLFGVTGRILELITTISESV